MPYRSISPSEARDRLRDAPQDFVLIDCREPEEWALASVPGTLNLSMTAIPRRLAELDKTKEIAVLCHSGARSAQVAVFLSRMGFPRVANVAGGIDAWAETVDPSIPRY